MSKGQRSRFPPHMGSHEGWKDVMIEPEGAQVKKVVIWFRKVNKGQISASFGGV